MQNEAEVRHAMRSVVGGMLRAQPQQDDFLSELVRSAIGEPLRAKQSRTIPVKGHIGAIVAGAVEALLELEADLRRRVPEILKGVHDAADRFELDRDLLVRAALGGLVDIAESRPESALALRTALVPAGLDERFGRLVDDRLRPVKQPR